MAEIASSAVPPDDMAWLFETVKRLEAQNRDLLAGFEKAHNSPPVTPTYFRNDSGEEIPPHGCMQCVGTVHIEGDRDYEKVDKPADQWFESGAYMWNGEEAVPSGGFGTAQVTGRRDIRMIGPVGIAGDRYLPKVDSWEIEQVDGGHIVYSGPDQYRTDYDVNRCFHPIPDEGCIVGDLTTCLKYNESGSIEYNGRTINFDNTWNLDAMPGKVKLCKTGGVWRLEHRSQWKARWMTATKTASGWSLASPKHGFDPTPCGVSIICNFDCSCMSEGDTAVALYDMIEDVYEVVSSDSATLGPFVDVPLVLGSDSEGGGNGLRFSGCTLNGEQRTGKLPAGCLGDVEAISEALALVPVTVMSDLDYSATANCLDKDRVTLYVCSSVTAATTTLCGDDCATSS